MASESEVAAGHQLPRKRKRRGTSLLLLLCGLIALVWTLHHAHTPDVWRSGRKERSSWRSSEEPRDSASLALPIHSAAARVEVPETSKTNDVGRQSALELASTAAADVTTHEKSASTADISAVEGERQRRVELDTAGAGGQAAGSPEATTLSPWIGDTALEEETGNPAAADSGDLDQGAKHLSAPAGEPRASSAPTGPEVGGDDSTAVQSGNETVGSTADDGGEQQQAGGERTESSAESAVDRADWQGASTAELDERIDVRANATTTLTTLEDANTTNLTTLEPPQAVISASAIAAALLGGGGAAKRPSDSAAAAGGASKASASPPSVSKVKLEAATAQHFKTQMLAAMTSAAAAGGASKASASPPSVSKVKLEAATAQHFKTQMLAAMTIQADAQAQTGPLGSGISGGHQRWSQLQAERRQEREGKRQKELAYAEGEDAWSVPSEVLDTRDARYKARMVALRQVMQGHGGGRAKLKPWMVDLLLPVGTTKELGLHVVFTHFLLGRGHLPTLAEVRFKLFTAFTLPSMVQQSSRSFIWIVYVDERLPVAMRASMQALMQAHKQFHVVVVNPAQTHPSSMKLAPQLALAHQLYPNLLEFVDLVVYTRVDADDALERTVLSTLQEQLETFEQRATYRWLCWQDSLTWVPRGLMGVTYDGGRVFMSSVSAQCSPAGLTMVSRLGTPHPVFQRVMHTRVRKFFGAAKTDRNTPEVPCADPPPMPSESNPPACLHELRSPLMASMRSVTLASNGLGLFHPRKVRFTSNRSLDTWAFTHRTLGHEPAGGRKAPAVVVAGESKSKYTGLAPGVEWDGPSEALLKRGFGVDRVKLTTLSDVFADANTSLRLVTELQALPPCQSSWGCYVSPSALATALGNYQRSVVAHLRDEPMQHKAHGKLIVAAEAASQRAAADDHHLPRCGAAEHSRGIGGLLGWIASVTHWGADSSTRLCRVPDDARQVAAEGGRGAGKETSIDSADRDDTETEQRPDRFTEPLKPAAEVGVTLVTQATVNYVPFILEIAKRWAPCPMSSAIYGKLTEFNQLMGHNELEFPTNLKLVFEKVTHTNKSYPINHMRNLALNAVTTTHVLLSDADMLPSVGLCKRATAALSEVADEERKHGTEVAVVVPAFDVSDYYEARIRAPCNLQDTAECVRENMALKTHATTFRMLHKCLERQRCVQFRNPSFHRGGLESWASQQRIFPMECIPQKYQSDLEHAGASLSASELWAQLNGWQLLTPDFEPYVLIRAPPESPCDERFQNYGKNKVSFITSLFYRGFRFYGLPREFVFHMTHPKSLSRLTWEKGTRFEMRMLWRQFLSELQFEFGTPRHAPSAC